MDKKSIGRLLWGLALVLAWSCVLYFFIKSSGDVSVEDLLRYKPGHPAAAALAMCALFALKGVDFVLHSGVLYAVSGIMFPLWSALLLSLCGAFLMSCVPYAVGRSLGQPVLRYVAERYPRFRVIESIRSDRQLVIALMIRLLGMPLAVAGLYMGAAQFRFGRYMLGSLLGLLPSVVCFTVMGVNAADRSSPAFWIALGVHVLMLLASAGIYAALRRRGAQPLPRSGLSVGEAP
ncbi:MAG: VTT domain-containing protein [Oscillospiraceae bacterium]|nr:VTT domain-containing protein [Oscillospiraceae bacterium]